MSNPNADLLEGIDGPVAQAAASISRLGISPLDVGQLAGATPTNEVKTRQGPGGRSLSYVDARFVMRRLDEVAGPENWQRDHRLGADGKVACGIGILIDGEWVWKWDGAGETDIEGEKGSFSDAFKRAAVSWGIARDLYDNPSPAGSVGGATPSASPTPVPSANAYTSEERGDGDKCPLHGYEWKSGRYGWFCSGKAREGEPSNKNGFCIQKPSPAWAARHEVES